MRLRRPLPAVQGDTLHIVGVGDNRIGKVLCYNGEIYNYRTLRRDLESKGETFLTDSDTEVCFAGLKHAGIDFLNLIDGMYAIAWYDSLNGRLLIARDPGGMKPLYYRNDNGELIFSSELRSIREAGHSRQLDMLGFSVYAELGFVSGPRTLLHEIRKLCPGEWRDFDVKKKKFISSGFVSINLPENNGEFSATIFRAHLQNSVRDRLTGLRPVGLNLSGGLDSSAILHEASELGGTVRSFSARYDINENSDRYNEDADIARKLSKHYGTVHQEIVVTEEDFVNALEPTIAAL